MEIGEIVKPQGINGEVKAVSYAGDVNCFKSLKQIRIDGEYYPVVRARVAGGYVFLTLKNVTDRNAAELLRNKKLYVARGETNTLGDGEYYVSDVTGLDAVFENGEKIGKVAEILKSASADIYCLDGADGKEISFPLLKDVLIEINVQKGYIMLKKKRFEEIACYED